MRRTEDRFQRLLAQWVGNDTLRDGWTRHFYERGPAPDEPRLASPPLFVGATDSGAVLEIRAAGDGGYDLLVDGALARHEAVPWHLDAELARPLRAIGRTWHEQFSAPDEAVGALAALVASPRSEPPWAWARALYEDGWITLDFAVTARGRRGLDRVRPPGATARRARFCVLAADTARARILTLPGQRGALVEIATLTNRERRARDSDVFSDPRPGMRRESAHGPRHGVDDRRDHERRSADRRFAKLVVAQTAELALSSGASELIIVAGPTMLGLLRPALGRRNDAMQVREVARDLTQLGPAALQDALAQLALVPPRERRPPIVPPAPGLPV